MALINCNECNSRISDNANSCPNCGNPNLKQEQKNNYSTAYLVIGLIVTLLILFNTCDNSSNDIVAEEAPIVESEPTIQHLSPIERKENIEKIRNIFLDSGMDVKVKVYGKDNETLELEYVLFTDVWLRKFETTGALENFNKMGFKKIIFNDGYDYKTTVSYK